MSALKNSSELAQELDQAIQTCSRGPRRQRLIRALSLLEHDPIFAENEIRGRIEESQIAGSSGDSTLALYKRLSSGHKIVLLIISRLIATVEEKSLVLLDEPEAHLHPPLLSAFIRALSDLLTNRNGLAILATHSPVVLQEVPAKCVWILSRSGKKTATDRPTSETFAENVGMLTNDVFGLEVINTGFHSILTEAALDNESYKVALDSLNGEVGNEGRGILRSNFLIRQADNVDTRPF